MIVVTRNAVPGNVQLAGKAMIDAMIRKIGENYELLCSNVPDSRLHEIINNPVDEGIDEG